MGAQGHWNREDNFGPNSQSWTKGWRQIHEINQSRLFYKMFCMSFFAGFYQKMSKFGFRLERWVLAIKSKHFRDFLEGARQFVTQLAHSFSADNNLAPFHLWGREIVLENEKV